MLSMPKAMDEPQSIVKLGAILQSLPRVIIMLSGGMDSAFLLWACTYFLDKSQIKAVTFYSPTTPQQELARAVQTTEILQVEHIILNTPEMEDELFSRNDLLRCYYCKRSRFTYMLHNMGELPATLLDGSHGDDLKEYRPGMKALGEFNIISPLLMAGLDRASIINLCHFYHLPFTGYPTESCLATRIKTGQHLDADLLARLDELEEAVRLLGITLVRARFNNGEIRLEVRPEEIPLIIDKRAGIVRVAQTMGLKSIALDLNGYGQQVGDSGEILL